jgi:aspartyl aminopeptidase
MTSKSRNEKLQEKLFTKKESAWESYSPADKESAFAFAEKYKLFLKESKTERLCVKNICSGLKKSGFVELGTQKLKTGDRVFKNYKNKAVLAAVIGQDNSKFNLIGSHLDSPRLDLKQSPLFEDSGFALLKSHYYGGIKKYHWVNTPLSMYGVIHTKSGRKVEISIGDNEGDPQFIIPDLLPHLAKKQMEKTGDKIIEGEQLNILVGSIPVKDEKIKEKIKFTVLKYLNEKYKITESDFMCAEIEFVPTFNPVDIGFDKSMIAAYGQDDKCCSFASYWAIRKITNPKRNAIALFADKEEIGSMGDSGAASHLLENFVMQLLEASNVNTLPATVFETSQAISADVDGGLNPMFKEVQDPLNVPLLGHGVTVTKYTGGGGKYSSNDASAEYMQKVRELLDKNEIKWQTGELGKIDEGGGGTIAMYMSKYGIDTVDAGPALLAMHSPLEVMSKADLYECYKFYKAFFTQ